MSSTLATVVLNQSKQVAILSASLLTKKKILREIISLSTTGSLVMVKLLWIRSHLLTSALKTQ